MVVAAQRDTAMGESDFSMYVDYAVTIGGLIWTSQCFILDPYVGRKTRKKYYSPLLVPYTSSPFTDPSFFRIPKELDDGAYSGSRRTMDDGTPESRRSALDPHSYHDTIPWIRSEILSPTLHNYRGPVNPSSERLSPTFFFKLLKKDPTVLPLSL